MLSSICMGPPCTLAPLVPLHCFVCLLQHTLFVVSSAEADIQRVVGQRLSAFKASRATPCVLRVCVRLRRARI